MKKVWCTLIFFLFPVFVTAATINYDLENFLIDAEIQDNGDLFVRELIVLDGTFNGYIRDISYANPKLKYQTPVNFSSDAIYNGTRIENMKIGAKKINNQVSFETMEESFQTLENNYSTNYRYETSSLPYNLGLGTSYKMYFSSKKEKVAFLLSYTISDVVVIHNDTAEVYWTFLGEGFEDKIENVSIKLHFPFNNTNLRVWAHGELTGNIKKENNTTVEATISNLSPKNAVDIRATFDKETIINANKISNTAALNKIIEVEEKRAEEANKIRKKAKIIVFVLSLFSGLHLIFLIITWIYVYLKYDREYKPTFNLEYNREFIDDYNVEVVDYIMHQTIGENAMSASILNLIYKKNIKVEEVPTEKKKKNYKFTLLNMDNINQSEQLLIKFLFEKVGKNQEFTTEELKKYAESTKTYESYRNSHTAWRNSVINDAKKECFFENKKSYIGFGIMFCLLGAILMFCSMSLETALILPSICFAFGTLFILYCAFLRKRTRRGAEHYAKWKAFKKFLEDFGNFEIKELPEIVLWERYLVYATIFGLADKVQKAMNVKIKEMGINSMNVDYYPSWIDYSIASSISRSINESYHANQTKYSREVAQSSMSSGHGGGGGFSSGGGFGGGGGGGRGF